MSDARHVSGRCLCGAVSFTAQLPNTTIQACHCMQCQTWTSGGPLYAIRVQELEISGSDTAQSYRASDWGERVFCSCCGTALWWKLQGHEITFVSPGLLDDKSGLELREEIFIDHRPDWLPARAGATQSTEAEMKQQLSAFLEGKSHDQI